MADVGKRQSNVFKFVSPAMLHAGATGQREEGSGSGADLGLFPCSRPRHTITAVQVYFDGNNESTEGSGEGPGKKYVLSTPPHCIAPSGARGAGSREPLQAS